MKRKFGGLLGPFYQEAQRLILEGTSDKQGCLEALLGLSFDGGLPRF